MSARLGQPPSGAPTWSTADALMARLLVVAPRATPAETAAAGQSADRLIGVALMVSAVRCTLAYVVLPFVLPFIGVLTGAARLVTLTFDAIALVALIAAVRRFWAARHPHRWRYLVVAVGALLLAIFLATPVAT